MDRNHVDFGAPYSRGNCKLKQAGGIRNFIQFLRLRHCEGGADSPYFLTFHRLPTNIADIAFPLLVHIENLERSDIVIYPSSGGELSPSYRFCPYYGTPVGLISQVSIAAPRYPLPPSAAAGALPTAAPGGRLTLRQAWSSIYVFASDEVFPTARRIKP
jgi:hypothetical protein